MIRDLFDAIDQSTSADIAIARGRQTIADAEVRKAEADAVVALLTAEDPDYTPYGLGHETYIKIPGGRVILAPKPVHVWDRKYVPPIAPANPINVNPHERPVILTDAEPELFGDVAVSSTTVDPKTKCDRCGKEVVTWDAVVPVSSPNPYAFRCPHCEEWSASAVAVQPELLDSVA